MKKYYIRRSDFVGVVTGRENTLHILWPFVIKVDSVMFEVTNHDADPTRSYYFFHTYNADELKKWIEKACQCQIQYLDDTEIDIGNL